MRGAERERERERNKAHLIFLSIISKEKAAEAIKRLKEVISTKKSCKQKKKNKKKKKKPTRE